MIENWTNRRGIRPRLFCGVLSNGRCAGWRRGLLFNDIGPSRGEIEADFDGVGIALLVGGDGNGVVKLSPL